MYYDRFDPSIDASSLPTHRKLQAEAPLYYNEFHNFYAVSQAGDVGRALSGQEVSRCGDGMLCLRSSQA